MSADVVDSEGRFWRIEKWFPDLRRELVAQLRSYHSELIFFNGRMNLISPRTEKTADLVHIADGILGSRVIFSMTDNSEIFDIGSGNGVPGLIMAILEPARKITLVEVDARKIEFIKHCIARLGLKNCFPVHSRLEDIGEGKIKCAVTRGLASVSKALLMVRKPAAMNCEFYHFKGPSWTTEVAEIPSQILASWELGEARDYSLPFGNLIHTIVQTRKMKI